MTKKPDIVILLMVQILIGLGSGFIGSFLFATLEPLIFGYIDITGSVLYALVAGYFSMYLGIAIVSIINLKEFINKSQAIKIILYTFPGLILILYLFIFSDLRNTEAFGLILLPYPIFGLIYGFNRTLRKNDTDNV